MNTNYNSDISYQQSQTWNQRSNKFDLSTDLNENPKVFDNDENVNISEPTKYKEVSKTAKTKIIDTLQETQNSEEVIKEEIKLIETEIIETESKASLMKSQESVQANKLYKSEENPIFNSIKENSAYQANSGFHRWLKNLTQEPKEKLEESTKQIIHQNQLKPQKPVKTELEEIKDLSPASETLASLLVSQGYYKEAIAMYEKLSILIPEKKATFAALIGKLKN